MMIKSQTESQDNSGPALQETDGNSRRLGEDGRHGSLAKLNISSEALRALPADFVKRHRVLPFQALQRHPSHRHGRTGQPAGN